MFRTTFNIKTDEKKNHFHSFELITIFTADSTMIAPWLSKNFVNFKQIGSINIATMEKISSFLNWDGKKNLMLNLRKLRLIEGVWFEYMTLKRIFKDFDFFIHSKIKSINPSFSLAMILHFFSSIYAYFLATASTNQFCFWWFSGIFWTFTQDIMQ